jgi:hypothetical protein
MKILNNNNADYRTYEVEFFIYEGHGNHYSYTEDFIIDISKDDYYDNDKFYNDLFNQLENIGGHDCYKIRVSELFSINDKIYRTQYIKDDTGIHHYKNDIFTIE